MRMVWVELMDRRAVGGDEVRCGTQVIFGPVGHGEAVTFHFG